MKTYILRSHNSVEPQKPQFVESVQPQNPPGNDPTTAAITNDIIASQLQPPPSPQRVLFVGMDVHND